MLRTITAILRTRGEGGEFHSLEDFVRRVPVEQDEIESLIKCGAFDEMNDEACRMTRPEMLWRGNLLQAKKKDIANDLISTESGFIKKLTRDDVVEISFHVVNIAMNFGFTLVFFALDRALDRMRRSR